MKNKSLYILFLCIIALSVKSSFAQAPQLIYVAEDGNDKNEGTEQSPLSSVQAAVLKATNFPDRPVQIMIRPGSYYLDKTIVLDKRFRRSAGHPVIIRGDSLQKPVLCGGKKLPRFTTAGNGLWKTYIPETAIYGWRFEQLYVNGKRALPASAPNEGFFKPRYVTETVLVKDNTNRHDLAVQKIGIPYESAAWLKGLTGNELSKVFANFYHNWDNTIKPLLFFKEEDTAVYISGQVMKPWNPINKNSQFRFVNLEKALDAPGEWYLEESGMLYYKPYPGEKIEETVAIAPVLEKLISIAGDSSARVENIYFKDLSFRVTGYHFPSAGTEPQQAAASVEAAIQIDYANNIEITNCDIQHTGNNAVWFRRACSGGRVEHCYMQDLGAGAVKIGETVIREDAAEITNNIIVNNNIMQSGGHVFPCAVAMIIFNAHDNQVTHNDIGDFRYSAISAGWVWGYSYSPAKQNLIAFNHLHHIGWGELSDMGGVYTLGASEGTVVKNNVIHHVYSFDYGGWGLYTDEGSAGIIMENNLVYACKNAGFHQHYGKDNIIRNNIFAFNVKAQLQATRIEPHNSFTFTNNIIYYTGDLLLSNWYKINLTTDYNCYYNASGKEVRFNDLSFAGWKKQGKDIHSVIEDPGFMAPEKFDFRLKNKKAAKKIRFTPFDYSAAGVYGSAEWKEKAELSIETEEKFDAVVRKLEAR